jgi:PIN domain nuclease of toxin-antitoxin system
MSSAVLDASALGLSLGDRACLALGRRLKLPVLTADQIWKKVELEI